MSRHILVVTPDEEYAARFPDARPYTRYRYECTVPGGCGGWEECCDPAGHEGFDPEDETSPAYDQHEDVEIHGVLHEWRWGYEWTVPFVGCVVKEGGYDPPEELYQRGEDGWELPVGRWVVEDEWHDEECYMKLVGPEEA